MRSELQTTERRARMSNGCRATASWRLRRVFYCIALIALLAFTPSVYYQSVSANALAEDASDRAELYQALLDLTNPWTVMCVAAHPDDEDGATLTILRRKYGAHTVSLFSTYGEGGQNAIGPELYEELGVIRAKETLRAAEIQGSEPHFLGLRDFGFSKSADETFRIWGHDEALRRMVLQIRTLRPDVIITNHDTTSGHGHHQATGRLVLEAFHAAANPKRFAEQLRTVRLWQPKRLFVRVNYEGGTASRAPKDEAAQTGKIITINPNERDPVRGLTYAEQALHALQQHASQGPWPNAIPKDGSPFIRYLLAAQSKMVAALPINSQTVFDGLRLPARAASYLAPPTIEGRALIEFLGERQRIFQTLIAARRTHNEFSASLGGEDVPRFFRMVRRLNNAVLEAGGIKVSLKADSPVLIPGTTTTFSITVSNQGDEEILLPLVLLMAPGFDSPTRRIDLPDPDWSYARRFDLPRTISAGSTASASVKRETPLKARINVPGSEHLYDGTLFGEEYTASVSLEIAGATFPSISAATTRLNIAPAVEISGIMPSPYIFTPANLDQPLTFRVQLINHQNKPFKGEFGIASPTDSINEVGDEITLEANAAKEFTLRTNVIPVDTPDERRTPRANFGPIVFSVHLSESATSIDERETRLVYAEARVSPNVRVGYVRSFDDTLRNALNALGVENKELSIDDVRTGDLKEFDTIILDNRGYQAHPELVQANQRLLDFAQSGGTLIVFYHKANEWNPDPAKDRPRLAPLSIILGSARVTDENAPVTFAEPQHQLLNFPNQIGSEDFGGWVQERGLYYPEAWDKRYQAPLSMSDAGEKPLHGGLLTLDYGRGRYIYTSMVWYRQLRAGVPGAYRIFANMISYGHPVQNRER